MFDETGDLKKGTATVRVQRQYAQAEADNRQRAQDVEALRRTWQSPLRRP